MSDPIVKVSQESYSSMDSHKSKKHKGSIGDSEISLSPSSSVFQQGNQSTSLYNIRSPNNSILMQSPPSGSNLVPISALTPYSGSKWHIIARVTYKSEILSFRNGSGRFFTIHLVDSFDTEIRCTFYTDACEMFYELIEVNKVYKFSNAKVKDVLDRKYTSIKNSYDLTFERNSVITNEVDNGDIKLYVLNSTKISKLSDIDLNRMVDVMGMVKTVLEVNTFQTQKKPSQKRDVIIFDETGEVRLTLWDDLALAISNNEKRHHQIIGVKNVKISEYMGGRTLSTSISSTLVNNPTEGDTLRQWVALNGGDVDAVPILSSLSPKLMSKTACDSVQKRQTINFIRGFEFGQKEEGVVVTLKVTITHVHRDRNLWYDACPTKGCNKKVIESQSNCWQCGKCEKEFSECRKRFILNCTCSDYTGQLILTFYNDQAEKLLGVTADILNTYYEQNQMTDFESVFNRVLFNSYVLSARVKQKVLKDDVILESTVLRVEDMRWGVESHQLFDKIATM